MKKVAGKTKEERIEMMVGEIKAHRDDDRMIESIVAHHIGVLFQTIEECGERKR